VIAIRWSDDDRYFGPFTYSRGGYFKLAAMLCSGDDDDYPGCHLKLQAFSHTLITRLPRVVRPWRERLGDRYFHSHPRDFGFSLCAIDEEGSADFLQLKFGAQTGDSATDMSWCIFLPWMEWRHVRHSLYDREGRHWHDLPNRMKLGASSWEDHCSILESCPRRRFAFRDVDGEELIASTCLEEREWHRGAGWFKWLSRFYSPRVQRYLDIEFSGETGEDKGSWKGGAVAHAIKTRGEDELHYSAFKRYCEEHDMEFLGEILP